MFGSRWRQKPPIGTLIDPSHPFAAGLVAFWAFNEGTGVPADSVSHLPAASNNAPWGTGNPTGVSGFAAGYKLSFNGTSQYVGLGSSNPQLNITGPISIVAMCGPPADNTARLIFGGYAATGYAGFGFATNFATSTNELAYWSSSFGSWVGSNLSVVDGNGHVFAVSCAGSASGQTAFYRDGVPIGTATSAFPGSYGGQMAIGARSDGALRYLSGGMSWVGIWNVSLPAAIHAAIGSNVNAIWSMFRPMQVTWSYAAAGGASSYWGRISESSALRPITGPAVTEVYG